MCEPTTMMVGMMVMQGASMAIQQYQSNKARDAAQDAAKKQEKLAIEAERNQLEALEAQMEQESDKTALMKLDRQRQALRERAKIRVAAAESGGFGMSTMKELSASHIGEGMETGVMDYNLRATGEQLARQSSAISINTRRDIANQRASVPLGTPTWMQGLNIGLAAGQGYLQGASMSGGMSPSTVKPASNYNAGYRGGGSLDPGLR